MLRLRHCPRGAAGSLSDAVLEVSLPKAGRRSVASVPPMPSSTDIFYSRYQKATKSRRLQKKLMTHRLISRAF